MRNENKIELKDLPWRLNPTLSHKEIRKAYEEEVKKVDDMAAWRKSPYKIPGYPGAYYCVVHADYTKYQGGN